VRGITTAATVWAVAAIGVGIALELYLVGLVATAAVLLVLEMRPLSEYLSGRRSDPPLPWGHGPDEEEGLGRTED
jgi:putative Mg2+ transporter-C (MgtC) family protein